MWRTHASGTFVACKRKTGPRAMLTKIVTILLLPVVLVLAVVADILGVEINEGL
jgi:hypothetical protein